MDAAAGQDKVGKRVVLCYPFETQANLPLGLLAVAGPLEKAGYDVKLIAACIEADYREQILNLAREALCIGISCAIGPQVVDALEVSKLVKNRFPALPIVWGGWFPTMCPEPAIASPHVDIVARGQGEATLLEIVQRLDGGLPLDPVKGISFKRNGAVVVNPDRPIEDINAFPPLPYHLIDTEKFDALTRRTDEDGWPFVICSTSRGCPNNCSFCSNEKAYKRRWVGLTPERVVDEFERIMAQRGKIHIRIPDANFFAGLKRACRISELIVRRNLAGKFRWSATGSTNFLLRADDDMLALFKKSGLYEVYIGVESGDPVVLGLFDKRATPEDNIELVERLNRHGINMILNFIVGVPGEPPDALTNTLDMAARLYHINPRYAQIDINFFQPLPGTRLAADPLIRKYYKQPRTLEEWGQSGFRAAHSLIPVFSKRYLRQWRHFYFYSHGARFLDIRASRGPRPAAFFFRLLRSAMAFRMKHRSMILAPEFFLLMAAASFKKMLRRSKGSGSRDSSGGAARHAGFFMKKIRRDPSGKKPVALDDLSPSRGDSEEKTHAEKGIPSRQVDQGG